MSPSDPPRRQDPYLSTEDIIQRVRITQGRGHPFLVFRGPMAVIGALAVILCLLLLLHRAREHEHRSELQRAEQQAESDGTSQATEPLTQRLEALAEGLQDNPQTSDQATEQNSPEAKTAPAALGSEHHTQLTIFVAGRPGIISMDGRRLTVDRRWSGKVSPGRHQLSVRCDNLTLKKHVDVQHKALKVGFDCSGRRD